NTWPVVRYFETLCSKVVEVIPNYIHTNEDLYECQQCASSLDAS
ncbi:13535_t:CDS:2, partial [Funneliformis mosseae]